MMFMIDENFKVIGKGDALRPNKEKGEFVLHTSVGKAVLKEVAKGNDVEVGKKDSTETLIKKIEVNFNKKELTTMTETKEKTELELKCEKIVKTGMEAGKDDDSIQVDLVGAGLKFRQAASIFKKLSESLGFRITTKMRTEKVTEILKGYIPKTWDEVTEAVTNLVEKVEDTTEAQAMACLRKIVKEAEKEFPKKPKGGEARTSVLNQIGDFMLENHDCTNKDIIARIKEIKPNVSDGSLKSYIMHTTRMLRVARAW